MKYLEKDIVLPVCALVLFVFTFWPAFKLLGEKWLYRDEYDHAFLTLLLILYMVWNKKEKLIEISRRFSIVRLGILFSLILYVFSLSIQVHTLVFISMYLVLVGTVIYFFGIDSMGAL